LAEGIDSAWKQPFAAKLTREVSIPFEKQSIDSAPRQEKAQRRSRRACARDDYSVVLH